MIFPHGCCSLVIARPPGCCPTRIFGPRTMLFTPNAKASSHYQVRVFTTLWADSSTLSSPQGKAGVKNDPKMNRHVMPRIRMKLSQSRRGEPRICGEQDKTGGFRGSRANGEHPPVSTRSDPDSSNMSGQIVPKRFGLKYSPKPAIALEYQKPDSGTE